MVYIYLMGITKYDIRLDTLFIEYVLHGMSLNTKDMYCCHSVTSLTLIVLLAVLCCTVNSR